MPSFNLEDRLQEIENLHVLADKAGRTNSKKKLLRLIDKFQQQYNYEYVDPDLNNTKHMSKKQLRDFLRFNLVYGRLNAIYRNKTLYPKKAGRPGDKIKRAFSNVPSEPISIIEYAKKTGVSVGTLTQGGSRYKHLTNGKIKIKLLPIAVGFKEKIRMIWCEPEIITTPLTYSMSRWKLGNLKVTNMGMKY